MYRIGDQIKGEYAVSAVFTNGGMGLVYKIHHPRWHIDMAMKCPRAEFFRDEDQKKTFVHECETWMNLGVHPNIVTCYYIASIDNVPSIFMEYADGGSLMDMIKSGRLYEGTPTEVLERILDVAIQTSRGLAFAHEKGYVHQDVKPANVLMTKSGEAKISDFGLAKARGGLCPSARMPNGQSVIVSSGGWTPAYGSPEQALGMPLSRRTDIWSWGAMVLEMVHGSMFWRIGPGARRALDQLWPWQVFSGRVKRSKPFLSLIQECLSEKENNRPHSFNDIERRLIDIYEVTFLHRYERMVPPLGLLSEATLCNRIASFGELDKVGDNYFSKVYDSLKEIRRVSPWSIYGELNYVIYLCKNGWPINDIIVMAENLINKARTGDVRAWVVDLLLKVGITNPYNNLYRKLKIKEDMAMLNQVRQRHEIVRDELFKVFKYEKQGYSWESSSHDGGLGKDESHNLILGRAVSEHGDCSVCVVRLRTNESTDWEGAIRINAEVKRDGKIQHFAIDDDLCVVFKLHFITVDDQAKKLSLWVYRGERGLYQKVYALEDGRLVPYWCDFRETEHWGEPSSIYESGDAKVMMLLYRESECVIWSNPLADAGNGRNICRVDFNDYGLIPPDAVLPGFRMERGFEYGISEETAYRLAKTLSRLYGQLDPEYYISLPCSSLVELERSRRGYDILQQLKIAVENGDMSRELSVGKECCRLDVLPDANILERRNQMLWKSGRRCLIRAWRCESFDEYWGGNMLRLFSIAASEFSVVTVGSQVRRVTPLNEHVMPFEQELMKRNLVCVHRFENGDVLATTLVDDGLCVTGMVRCHYDKNVGVREVWQYSFKEEQYFWYDKESLALSSRYCSTYVRDEGLVVLDIKTGTVVCRFVDVSGQVICHAIDFTDVSPIGLFLMTDRKIYAYDHQFCPVSSIGSVPLDAYENKRIKGISRNGLSAIVDDGYVIRVLELPSGRCRDVINLLDIGIMQRWYGLSGPMAITESGEVIAAKVGWDRFMIVDVETGRVIFDERCGFRCDDLCFDQTGRWLLMLHDYKKLELYQLFWDKKESVNLN